MEILIAIVVVAFVLVLGPTSLKIIRPYEKGLVERLGQYQNTRQPGLNVIVPLIDRMVKVDMRERVIDVPPQQVITKDNVGVAVDLVLYFQVTDPFKVIYNVEDFNLAVTKLAQTNLRNQVGDLTLDETLVSRERINSSLQVILDEATDRWGIKVTRVEIQAIDPPADITNAMARQMKAEREKRAVILEAEGIRQSQITKAEGSKQSAILTAEGQATSIQKIAEAEKYQRIANAQGESQAIGTVFNAIHEGHPTNELITLKYLEALTSIAQGQATKIFLPLETSGILSGLATVLEAAKEFKEPQAAPSDKQGAGAS
ncbi:MAG TPA: SPFH/Band 7/PHB domain protein [Candidatus Fraserbacteria bacterium]|nr:SPFH/Band 7/PHB domain protein [Candidatus Fraserbacteria bacterium]